MARKQFLSFLLIFSLLISYASALAEADDDDDWDDNVDDAWEMEHPLHSGDYAYALLDDGTVEITSYGGADTEIVIPDTLDGKPVTAIGERAFYYSLSLTSVTIPDSVTHISQKAFSCCFQLTSITLPSGLTAIESGTFDLCKSLTTIDIPDSVAAIADDAFIGCKALQSFTLSPNHPYFFLADDALCRTADSTFLLYPNAREPRTYRIPDGITAISAYAFYDCDLLESVVVPDSVTQLPARAFFRLFGACFRLPARFADRNRHCGVLRLFRADGHPHSCRHHGNHQPYVFRLHFPRDSRNPGFRDQNRRLCFLWLHFADFDCHPRFRHGHRQRCVLELHRPDPHRHAGFLRRRVRENQQHPLHLPRRQRLAEQLIHPTQKGGRPHTG